MSVQHFFHCSLMTCPRLFKGPFLRNGLKITKPCPLMYSKFVNSLNCPNVSISTATCPIRASNFSTNSQMTLDIDAEIVSSPTQLASAIRQEASTIDKMVLSLPEEAICKCIRFLEDIEMPLANIQKLLASHPEILWIEGKKWEVILTVLSTYGLNNKSLCQILENFPTVLQLSPGNLNDVIESLRKIGIYDKNLAKIIAICPEIFLVAPSAILKRSKQLRFLFKTDDVLLLIRKSPMILAEDWQNIEKKFHYVFGVMGITQPQMRHSNLFSYSIEHIQTRHLWVERCGLFKKFKAKEDKKLNPRLGSMIDSSDQIFAKKFGNMTLEEYKTFSKLIQNQIDNTEEDSDFEDDE